MSNENNENKVINDILNEIMCKIEEETSSVNSLTIKIPPETYENIELSENLVIRRNNPEITNQLTREMRTYYIHNPVVKLFVSSVFTLYILFLSFLSLLFGTIQVYYKILKQFHYLFDMF